MGEVGERSRAASLLLLATSCLTANSSAVALFRNNLIGVPLFVAVAVCRDSRMTAAAASIVCGGALVLFEAYDDGYCLYSTSVRRCASSFAQLWSPCDCERTCLLFTGADDVGSTSSYFSSSLESDDESDDDEDDEDESDESDDESVWLLADDLEQDSFADLTTGVLPVATSSHVASIPLCRTANELSQSV